MASPSTNTDATTSLKNFERLQAHEAYTGLRAILDNLSADRSGLCEALSSTNSYEEFLAKLGYRITLTKQIHVQDAFSRLGSRGGIKAVLPYYDIPTKRSLPMVINYNSTVTATTESAGFFNKMLAALRNQLSAENKKAL